MEITRIARKDIVAGDNDRKVFDQGALIELSESIGEHGLIQPITIREIQETELYEIVAGERRFRACGLLGWDEIPAIIVDMADEEASAVMLSENISRQDLDPIDEAMAYRKRIDMFAWTVADCAEKGGVSAVRVRFRLKLLSLREDLQHLVRTGNLTIGYAQIIASAELDANFQTLAIRVLREKSNPNPGWFRGVCNELFTKQAQGKMFEGVLFDDPSMFIEAATSKVMPAHPSTTQPPTVGNSIKDIVGNQVNFWNSAATEWSDIGKPFKKQECEAAAQALQSTLACIA